MSRKSSLKDISPELLDQLNAAIRDDRMTIDELKDFLAEHGEEKSRSAVARYTKNFREGMEVYAHSQEMAKAWGKRLEEEPESDVAKLARGVLSSVALNTAQSMTRADEPMPANEVMFLAKALDHIAKADMADTQRILRIRQEAARLALKKATSEAEKVVAQAGVTDEQWALIRAKFLGVEVSSGG